MGVEGGITPCGYGCVGRGWGEGGTNQAPLAFQKFYFTPIA